jgi:chromosome segregation ATPase
MKQFLPTALALVCTVLVVFLIVMKRGDNAQHESDAGTIADFSNRLDSAHTDLAFYIGTTITLSNRLDEAQSASSAFSNQLIEAESTIALGAEQITNLNQQVTQVESENQTLSQRVMDLTNQLAGLASQIASTETNLDQANKDYALLENRFRRDVAERVVLERKFNNLSVLQAQIQELKEYPFGVISPESIYAGLDVEVKSNKFYVIAPN